jgi:hypothetical protein
MYFRGATSETELEPSLQLLFNNRSILDVMREGNIPVTTEVFELLDNISVKVLVSIYAAPSISLLLTELGPNGNHLALTPLLVLNCSLFLRLLDEHRIVR